MRRQLLPVLLLAGSALAFQTRTNSQPPEVLECDTLIRGARIVDGSGGPAYVGDVAIRHGRIVTLGRTGKVSAKWTVDAKGLTLAPGFIDSHSHARAGLERYPAAENLIRQGVTTILEGPDGSSPLPLGDYLARLEQKKLGINVGLLAGHGSIREKVMGTANRRATPEELEAMRGWMRRSMQEGAFGLSTGLFYVPGNFAPTEEVIELAKIAGLAGGIHTSHMRDEAARVVESVKETLRIGEEGHLPTQVTHHKIIGKANWGLSRETLRLVEAARARGVDATIDMYPYTASSTGTGALFPQWSLAGGAKALAERLAAPDARAKIKAEIVDRILHDRGAGDAKNVVMASCGFDRALAGKSLAQIALDRGRTASPEDAAETAIEIQAQGGCSAIYHAISEEDLERILKFKWTMVASDGGIAVPGPDRPHPRNYGTFARILARYVRERKTLTLEEAVYKMSGLPADRLGLTERGFIEHGRRADLVLFDPARIQDESTFENPHQYATGVDSVWVNGVRALAGGKMTGDLGGEVLRRPGTPPDPAFVIAPGRVGPVTPNSSEAQLIAQLGPARVTRGKIAVGEGFYEDCTWIDEGKPDEKMAIRWSDQKARRQPHRINLCDGFRPGRCKWRTADGLGIGSSLKQTETANGGPFDLAGFAWDGSGTVTDWRFGRVDRAWSPGKLWLRFEPSPAQTQTPEYDKVTGDRFHRSDLPAMQALNPRVYQIFVEFGPQ